MSGLRGRDYISMAQKRRHGNEPDDMTSREKKKLKLSAARTIATQAGPSSRTIPTNSSFRNYFFTILKEDSSGIRYGRYAQCHRYREICRSGWMLNGINVFKDSSRRQARAFEIDAMHTAMKTARYIHCPWAVIYRSSQVNLQLDLNAPSMADPATTPPKKSS